MKRWTKGEAEIESLVKAGELQHVTGGDANGRPRLDQARDRLKVAERAVDDDPGSAFTLAYDAARLACTGLLAQEGLRPTQRGGHVVVERSMRAQFGSAFQDFGHLRRRRNEIEYPAYADELVDEREAREAVQQASKMLDNAKKLVDQLGIF